MECLKLLLLEDLGYSPNSAADCYLNSVNLRFALHYVQIILCPGPDATGPSVLIEL